MMAAECLLQRVQFPSPAAALDGQHLDTLQLAGKQQAGPGCLAVDQDGAHAADAVLAAEMRAGEAEVVAQRVG